MPRPIKEGIQLHNINGVFKLAYRDKYGERHYITTRVKVPPGSSDMQLLEYKLQALEKAKAILAGETPLTLAKSKIEATMTIQEFSRNLFTPEGEYFQSYKKQYGKTPSPLTVKGYRVTLGSLWKHCGNIKIKDLSRKVLVDIFNEIQNSENKQSKYKTLVKILQILNQKTGKNYLELLPKQPKIKHPEKKIIPEEIYFILKNYETHYWNENKKALVTNKVQFRRWVFALLLYETGLRLCEARALCPKSIITKEKFGGLAGKIQTGKILNQINKNKEKGFFELDETPIYALNIFQHFQGRHLTQSEGKGKGSKRIVNIRPRLYSYLALLCDGLKPDDHIFPTAERNLQIDFRTFMKDLSGIYQTPHSARHFFQSFLPGKSLKNGTTIHPLTVSVCLGHSLPGAEMQSVYLHQSIEFAQVIADYFEEFGN